MSPIRRNEGTTGPVIHGTTDVSLIDRTAPVRHLGICVEWRKAHPAPMSNGRMIGLTDESGDLGRPAIP